MACAGKIQGAFYTAFFKWGLFVARRPLLVIVISVLLGFLCMTRLFIGDVPSETEARNLWVPPDSRANADQDKYDAIFVSGSRRNEVYFTSKPEGKNVLTYVTFSEMLRFDQKVKEDLFATSFGEDFSELELASPAYYEDVCYRSTTQTYNTTSCLQFGNPLSLFRNGGTYDFDLTDEQIVDRLNHQRRLNSETGQGFNIEGTFGGLQYDDDGDIVSAKAVLLVYQTNDDDRGEPVADASSAFEDQMNYMIGPDWTVDPPLSEGSAWTDAAKAGPVAFRSAHVEVYPETAGAIGVQLGEAVSGDVSSLTIGIVLIIAYAVLVLAKCHRVRSRALLALAGVASCGIAIGVSYGLTTAFGIPLNPVVNVLPFVLIGIGVDDMFVIVNALESTPAGIPRSERIARALATAGTSVTVTSFTDALAFALGTTSSLPALRDFCVFAVFGILGDFFFQLTFFAGWLALDVLREHSSRIDCLFCFKSTHADDLPACCCLPSCGGCARAVAAPPQGRLRSFIERFYVPLLRPNWAKWLVLVAFVAYTSFSAWAASNLEQDFKQRWFVPSDARLQDTFDIEDRYFAGQGPPVWTVTSDSADWDYTPIAHQHEYAALEAAVKANEWIIDDSVTSFYPPFKQWVWACTQPLTSEGCTAANGSATCVKRECVGASGEVCFPECSRGKVARTQSGEPVLDAKNSLIYGEADPKYVVDAAGARLPDGASMADSYVPPSLYLAWLDQFVTDSEAGLALSGYVRWSSASKVRSASEVARGLRGARMRAVYEYVDKAKDKVSSMQDLRATVDGAGIGPSGFAFPWMPAYLFYEQYAVLVREALLNLSLALVAVAIVTFLTMGDVRATCFVLLCVILTDIDILGLMWLWGLTIDSVSIINLVLAIGLSVDYSAHVAHAFVTSSGTKQERMEKAVSDMGVAVIHGAFSTFLAVLVLSSANSYIFRVFFKQFFGICIFGSAHGLIFLPALLGLFGPPPSSSAAGPAPLKGTQSTTVDVLGDEPAVTGTEALETTAPAQIVSAQSVQPVPSTASVCA